MGPLPQIAYPFLWGLPWATWALARLRPGAGAAVLIPSSLLRYLTFKLTWDLQQARAAPALKCPFANSSVFSPRE